MTSAFAVPPAALHDHSHDPRNPSPPAKQQHQQQHQRPSTTSLDSNHLSPLLSRATTDSVSPSENQYETPAASSSTLSHYQSSDFSDLEEDPFFGANFSNLQGQGPSFLDGQPDWDQSVFSFNNINAFGAPAPEPQQHAVDNSTYPLTPDPTASVHTTSPRSDLRTAAARAVEYSIPDSISPHELQKPFQPMHVVTQASQLTPSQSSSCRSSEDGLAHAPPAAAMRAQSPRVTVSVWDKESDSLAHTVERIFDDSHTAVGGGISSAGDLISSQHDQQSDLARRDSLGHWARNPITGHAGLDPEERPSDTVVSIKEATSQRETTERNQDVGKWLKGNLDDMSLPQDKTADEIRTLDQPGWDSNDGIPWEAATENRYVGGQVYYTGGGGQMNQEDYNIIAANDRWGDAPMLHQIRQIQRGETRHQPQSSQAAIEKFERMCRDNDSIFSRAATWGTRRRSIHSVADFDIEGVTSGNFLKKLSISRGTDKSHKSGGGIFNNLAGLMRRPSASKSKRPRSGSHASQNKTPYKEEEGQQRMKRESTPRLELPSRTSSWGKKPGLNITDAIMSVGHNAASVAATHHARSGSISGGTPLTSPRSPRASLSLSLNTLRRPRSKSELPKGSVNTAGKDTRSLVDLLKRSGGPPVAALSKANVEVDDDEDDEDDLDEDNDMQTDANIIDAVSPNFAGFQQHVITLNPGLETAGGYLVDRIAHQQIVRYKHLLNLKVKHLGLGANCGCGSLCIALGGSANVLDQKGDARGMDPLSNHYDDDDDDGTPTEGAITQESFPQDIPLPPTQSLPAEFECQLCYSQKKFQKPSDWTKHVHEDVQPFTCTWDKCRDPKIFKRKADWVRHENEGHRHLEWWTCDVEDCRHTCYRRDNFLQHLVREHKFTEPKVKTKAAMKRAGGVEPTWAKVEQCHVETPVRPQQEPCKFCGKTFPTWKKLTVHLAKHMEQISLPVLRLVAAKAKELDADTIISPVQDPPPRPIFPVQTNQMQAMAYPGHGMHPQVPYQDPNAMVYMTAPGNHFQQPYYAPHYETIDQSLQQAQLGPAPGQLHQGYDPSPNFQDIPVTTGPYVQASNPYMAMGDGGLEPFPQMNALGLQGVPTRGLGPQMAYDGMMASTSGHASPFSGQGSVSPYSLSPHQNQNRGIQENGWDERQAQGYQ